MKKGMKRALVVAILGALGLGAVRIGLHLASDAETMGMAVGLFFGVLAGIPAALLVLTAGRRHDSEVDAPPWAPPWEPPPAQPSQSPAPWVVVEEGRPPRQIAQDPGFDVARDGVTFVSPSAKQVRNQARTQARKPARREATR